MHKINYCDQRKLQIEQEQVFRVIQCDTNSPVYQQVLKEYEEVKQEFYKLCKPRYVLGLKSREALCNDDVQFIEHANAKDIDSKIVSAYRNQRLVIGVGTIGKKVEEKSSLYFKTGEYMKGLLLNTIADFGVFSLSVEIQRNIALFLERNKLSSTESLEYLTEMSILEKRKLTELFELERLLEVRLTNSGSFDPAKSICVINVIAPEPMSGVCLHGNGMFQGHDCHTCNCISCSYGKKEVANK